MSKYLQKSTDNITVLEQCFISFPNSKEMKNSLDIDQGNNILKTIAIFELSFFSDDNIENIINMEKLNIPYQLEILFDKIEEDKDNIYFIKNANTNLFKSNLYLNTVDTAYHFFSRMVAGKFNDVTQNDYKDLPVIFEKIMSENEVGGNIMIVYELLISELCRSKKDIGKLFRQEATMEAKASDFQMINIKEVPRTKSSFSALAGENIFEGMISAIHETKKGNHQQLTPLEQIGLNKF